MREMVPSGLQTVLNPTGICPLSAELSFHSPYNTSVFIKVLGSLPVEKKYTYTARSHYLPIIGLYPATSNKVYVRISSGDSYASDTLTIKTDSLYFALPDIEIEKYTASGTEAGMILCDMSIGNAGVFDSHPLFLIMRET